MIQTFVNRFMAAEKTIRAEYAAKRPESYDDLVTRVIESMHSSESDYDEDPDPERIHIIDDGSYQGTRLYIIGEQGYQPSIYWSIFVNYGSCSGCDAFQRAQGYADEISEEEVNDYWKLMLHMVQSMKRIKDGDTL